MSMKTENKAQRLETQAGGGRVSECLSQFLRALAMSIGILAAWMDFLNIPAWEKIFFLVILVLVLAAGLVVDGLFSNFTGKIPWIYGFFGFAAAILGNIRRLLEGVFAVINVGIAYWNIKEDDALPYIMNGTGSKEAVYLLGIVLVFFTAAVCWYLSWKGAIVRGFILSTLVLLPGILLKNCSFFGLVFITLGLIGLWLRFVMAGSYRMRLAWTILGGVLFVSIVAMSGNGVIDSITELRYKTLSLIDWARFGEDTLPEGDLTKACSMKQDDTIRLKVTSDADKTLYLRGYTAGQYKDGQWKSLKRSAYSGERYGFLKWLKNQDFSPNSEYALSRKINNDDSDDVSIIKVQNMAAKRKYYYTVYSADEPYGSYGMISKQDEGYCSFGLFGVEKYEMKDYSDNIPGELNKLEDWMCSPETQEEKDYLESEAVYRSFVYDSYMEIGDEFSSLIKKIFHGSGDADESQDSYKANNFQDGTENSYESVYTVTQKIREIMKENMVYSPTPVKPDEGEDPLKPFLRGERVGNSAFFATAGVLAFRSYGIPARYAEGYLKERQIDVYSERTVNLSSLDSHAWVEVYMDGLGWVPIDVTPGYYYDTYTLLQMSTLPDNIKKASVTANSENDTDSSLGINKEEEEEQVQEQLIENIAVPMAVSGAILLVVFVVLLLVTCGEIRILYEDWKIERLLIKSEKEDTAGKFAAQIEKQLARLGIEMHVGWQCAQTEEKLIEKLPQLSSGEYVRVNELLEKWIYGDERLELDEIRVLYTFLKRVKTMIDRYGQRHSRLMLKKLRLNRKEQN